MKRLFDNPRMPLLPPSPHPGPWRNSFAALGPAFYAELLPQGLAQPYAVAWSLPAARLLGLDAQTLQSPQWQAVLSGNAVPPGAQPLASVYSGHQFGVWAGQLGDGRALLLGELGAEETAAGAQEIQLKGSGLTPFSRMGDGRAVLRSSIREFLCSEAMHALGVPTTRALSLMGSDQPVQREEPETAAVVARLAPSFIRFGHFEHFSFHGQPDELRQLADYVMARFYPETLEQPNPYAALLQAVALRTAALLAHWQSLGFCHGVMNTDNMSILGLTLDYGPFQFMDGFDPGHICNHSDNQGRYAFANQPQVAYWNLHCLAHALLPLIGDTQAAQTALQSYQSAYAQAYAQRMAAKLGLSAIQNGQEDLVRELLALLAAERVDYSIFWRRLSHWAAQAQGAEAQVRALFLDSAGIDAWLLRYSEQGSKQSCGLQADLMLKSNPQYVLRNHLLEEAIQAAKRKDYSVLARLQRALETPYDAQPGCEALADFAPAWAQGLSVSCSS